MSLVMRVKLGSFVNISDKAMLMIYQELMWNWQLFVDSF